LDKALVSIHRDTLWYILLAYRCPEKIISIIKLFFTTIFLVWKKTKTIQLTDTPLPVKLENEDLEEVEEFTYLGSINSRSNTTVKHITNRLQKAKSSFVQLNEVWRSPNISEKQDKDLLQQRLISYTVWCRMLEGYLKRYPKTVRFHTSCLRTICRIYWPQKITNKECYQSTGQRDITTVIKQRRWKWLGHVIKKDRDSITRTALRWTPDSGRRKRGCIQETWRRTIDAEMKTTEKTWKELT